MPLKTLRDLLIQQLNELFAAEKHIGQVLPRLASVASSPRLADAFEGYGLETKDHLTRIESVFDEMDLKPRRTEAKGTRGLLEDCMRLANMESAEAHVRDAALIAVAQHVKHDEIAGYGCAKTWARLLGMHDAADLLHKSLMEERNADVELTRIAEELNLEAVEAGTD
ncbi:MAG: DUF892 family protein [Phycisphaerales bacterium]|nr:DUF892 family protein [Phycisphaerales bacterium]